MSIVFTQMAITFLLVLLIGSMGGFFMINWTPSEVYAMILGSLGLCCQSYLVIYHIMSLKGRHYLGRRQ